MTLDIVFFVVMYRAYKFVLREQQMQQMQPQHPPTPPAVVVFSTPTNAPPMYNPSFLQEVQIINCIFLLIFLGIKL